MEIQHEFFFKAPGNSISFLIEVFFGFKMVISFLSSLGAFVFHQYQIVSHLHRYS